MRLMTYNILNGGRDGRDDSRLSKVCELIRGVQPDVLVLEECAGFEEDGFRTLYRVERELSMRSVLARAESGHHVALFVRDAEIEATLCSSRELHHAALIATLALGSRRLTVIGAHLCPFSGQARLGEVHHLLGQLREPHGFLLGDLNALGPREAASYASEAWLPRRRARHRLGGPGGGLDTRAIEALEACGLVDTFCAAARAVPLPTCLTRLAPDWQDYQVRVDYVFATPAAGERVSRCERVDGPLADAASDHYALFVDVDIDG